VVTGDPDPGVSAEEIASTVKRRTRNGSILVMHANGRGRHTAEALPGMIEELRKRGFELTTVSDLLGNLAGEETGS
jgi:peptidoglycan/xylan/chitin deacetylase (PgdA/CDA1 family)